MHRVFRAPRYVGSRTASSGPGIAAISAATRCGSSRSSAVRQQPLDRGPHRPRWSPPQVRRVEGGARADPALGVAELVGRLRQAELRQSARQGTQEGAGAAVRDDGRAPRPAPPPGRPTTRRCTCAGCSPSAAGSARGPTATSTWTGSAATPPHDFAQQLGTVLDGAQGDVDERFPGGGVAGTASHGPERLHVRDVVDRHGLHGRRTDVEVAGPEAPGVRRHLEAVRAPQRVRAALAVSSRIATGTAVPKEWVTLGTPRTAADQGAPPAPRARGRAGRGPSPGRCRAGLRPSAASAPRRTCEGRRTPPDRHPAAPPPGSGRSPRSAASAAPCAPAGTASTPAAITSGSAWSAVAHRTSCPAVTEGAGQLEHGNDVAVAGRGREQDAFIQAGFRPTT